MWCNIVTANRELHRNISNYMHQHASDIYLMGCVPDDLTQKRLAQYEVLLIADNFSVGFAATLCQRALTMNFEGVIIALNPLNDEEFLQNGVRVFHGEQWGDLVSLIQSSLISTSP